MDLAVTLRRRIMFQSVLGCGAVPQYSHTRGLNKSEKTEMPPYSIDLIFRIFARILCEECRDSHPSRGRSAVGRHWITSSC